MNQPHPGHWLPLFLTPFWLGACATEVGGMEQASGGGGGEVEEPDFGPAVDPYDADAVTDINRFSDDAATLMRRSENPELPEAGEPIDFDRAPFITKGLGPEGQLVEYYNFDVQPRKAAPIYVLFREGEDEPVEGQLNVVDAIPGDAGYSDYWLMTKVTVPKSYEANSITSLREIEDAKLEQTPLGLIVNCPIVPEGSTATKRLSSDESRELTVGWYRDQRIYYFSFFETGGPIEADDDGLLRNSPIYVTFNDLDEGPASGFVTEMGGDQTHNVVSTLPDSPAYSPLWKVNVYASNEFDEVRDRESAMSATIVDPDGPEVNCPIVSSEPAL